MSFPGIEHVFVGKDIYARVANGDSKVVKLTGVCEEPDVAGWLKITSSAPVTPPRIMYVNPAHIITLNQWMRNELNDE